MRRPRPRIAGLDTCYRTSHTADAFWFGSPSRTATARLRREQDERYEEEADEPNQHPRLVSHLLPPAVPLDYRRHTVPPRTAAAADRAVPPACLLCPPAPPLGSPPIWPRPSNTSAPQSAPTGREVRVGKPDALRRTPPCGLTHHPRSLPPGARRALLSANLGWRRARRGGGLGRPPPFHLLLATHPPRASRPHSSRGKQHSASSTNHRICAVGAPDITRSNRTARTTHAERPNRAPPYEGIPSPPLTESFRTFPRR